MEESGDVAGQTENGENENENGSDVVTENDSVIGTAIDCAIGTDDEPGNDSATAQETEREKDSESGAGGEERQPGR